MQKTSFVQVMKLGTTSVMPGIAIIMLLVIAGFPVVDSLSFDTINFDYKKIDLNDHNITYQGNASASSDAIHVTTNEVNSPLNWTVGRAVYSQPLHLWDNASGNTADFMTYFSFAIDSRNTTLYADGLAFFLATYGTDIPNGSMGGYLGLESATFPDAYPFVAVEFDTYLNLWDPGHAEMGDVSMPHIGIDINSVKSVNNISWSWSDIPQGGRLQASIAYNSGTQNLSVVLTDGTDQTDIGHTTELWYQVQLKDLLPEWVTFGFSASSGSAYELHTVYSWRFSSTLQVADQIGTNNTTDSSSGRVLKASKGSNKTWIWAVTGVGLFLFIVMIVTFFSYRCKSKEIPGDELSEENDMDEVLINEEFEKVSGPRKFSYEYLAKATDDFAEHRQLGEGGFGKVYEGYLTELRSTVAIKRITQDSTQGMKEYMAEVKAVSQLRHRSLVQLIGWCHRKRELILIYEFMSNGSLDTHLFNGKSLLTWGIRYRIARDLAAALQYLHEEWAQCVLHRDIKCSNIMLDSSFNAKLGDFGLARLIDHGKGSQTTVLAGTIGYMAPECLYTGKASKESDVYSFGVVALEIACGRKVFEPRANECRARLVDWVWGLYGTGSLLEAADAELGIEFDAREIECLMIVGLWCAHPDYTLRPSMREVLSVLNFDAVLPVLQVEMPTTTYSTPSSNVTALKLIPCYSVRSSDSGTKSSSITTSSIISASSASSSSRLPLKAN